MEPPGILSHPSAACLHHPTYRNPPQSEGFPPSPAKTPHALARFANTTL